MAETLINMEQPRIVNGFAYLFGVRADPAYALV